MLAGTPIAGGPIAGRTTVLTLVATSPITRPLYVVTDLDGRATFADTEGLPMTDFWIKRGDTSPPITGQLLDGNLQPVDLTDATVLFKARDRETGDTVISRAASVDDAALALVRHQWDTDDTLIEAELLAEWQVTFADSTIQSWPNPGYIAVHVTGDAP